MDALLQQIKNGLGAKSVCLPILSEVESLRLDSYGLENTQSRALSPTTDSGYISRKPSASSADLRGESTTSTCNGNGKPFLSGLDDYLQLAQREQPDSLIQRPIVRKRTTNSSLVSMPITTSMQTSFATSANGPVCERRILTSKSISSDASTAVSLNKCDHHQEARLKSVLWRILLIVLPIASLDALFLGLIFSLKVQTEPSLFPLGDDFDFNGQNTYILVNLSPTRLGLVPNCMSLLAPCFGSLIMGLWRLCTARSLQKATLLGQVQNKRPRLPDVDDFRYVAGLVLASIGDLFRYCANSVKRRFVVPPVLHKAAAMLA